MEAARAMMGPGFYRMDCMDALGEFPDKFFDLAVVDPPYGIQVGRHKGGKIVGGGFRPFGGNGGRRKSGAEGREYRKFDDSRPPDAEYFRQLERVAKHRIIWGGNYMLDHLGAASCMLVWDKKRRGLTQADCEIAWTDLPGQSRIFEFKWNGMLQEDMKNKEERIHPTQKPVALYAWILARFAKPGDRILDTHAGSAGSLVACRRAGLDYWGYEIDQVFYDAAKERLDGEEAQVSILDLLDGG